MVSQVLHSIKGLWKVLALELFITMDSQVTEDFTLISGDVGAERAFEEDVRRGFR